MSKKSIMWKDNYSAIKMYHLISLQIMVLSICRDAFLPLGGDIDVTSAVIGLFNSTKFGKVLFDLHGFTVSMQI